VCVYPVASPGDVKPREIFYMGVYTTICVCVCVTYVCVCVSLVCLCMAHVCVYPVVCPHDVRPKESKGILHMGTYITIHAYACVYYECVCV